MRDPRGEGNLIPEMLFLKINLCPVIFYSYLDPESMATPTVQNWPNFCSDATRMPFSKRVTRVSEEGVAVRYVGVARPANG